MNKYVKYTLWGFLSLVLLAGAFSSGFVVGNLTSVVSAKGLAGLPFPIGIQAGATPVGASTATPTDLKTLFAPFWQTWDLVHKEYVDQPVDDTKLMQGAIRGMLAALGDPHTTYMDPKDFKTATSELAGEYEGIGAYVDTRGDYLKINSPMPGSPAEKAGLKSGDTIIAIDGKDMTGIDPSIARLSVLGLSGTTVTLTVMRDGVDKPFDVKVVRAKITIASVESKMLDNGIGYIKLNTFGTKTSDEFSAALKSLLAQKPKGLIFDLRNNGGGYLTTAIDISSQFIKSGLIVSEKYADGTVHKNNAVGGGLALDLPLVVLVNQYSASASEIVAGAIQDYGRGKLVGVTTYGKGSVQNWIPLSNQQGAARITIAKWLTPKGNIIDKIGLKPEIVVEMTQADIDAKRDPQLDAAIKALQGLLK